MIHAHDRKNLSISDILYNLDVTPEIRFSEEGFWQVKEKPVLRTDPPLFPRLISLDLYSWDKRFDSDTRHERDYPVVVCWEPREEDLFVLKGMSVAYMNGTGHYQYKDNNWIVGHPENNGGLYLMVAQGRLFPFSRQRVEVSVFKPKEEIGFAGFRRIFCYSDSGKIVALTKEEMGDSLNVFTTREPLENVNLLPVISPEGYEDILVCGNFQGESFTKVESFLQKVQTGKIDLTGV